MISYTQTHITCVSKWITITNISWILNTRATFVMLLNGALFSVPFTILYYATRRYLLVFFSGKSDIYLFNFQFSLIPKINSEQGCGNWRMWTGLRQTSFLPCWDPKEVRAWFQDFLLSFILPPWGFGWVGMSIWENFLFSLYDVPLILHFQFSFNCWKIDILRSNLNWHMQWSYLCFSTCEQQLKISVTFLSETKRGTVVEKCSVVNLFIHWTISASFCHFLIDSVAELLIPLLAVQRIVINFSLSIIFS